MASYNELLALIDAYINQNGVQAITGQVLNGVLRAMVDQLGRGYSIMGAADPTTDPGTPDGPESWFASVPGTYTNFDGIQIADGELALLSYTPSDGFAKNTLYDGFQEVTAQIDGNVGTPAVGVSYANGILSFDFHNMKGETGDPAGFGSVSATIDDNIGTPSVSVAASGPDTARNFAFNFRNLKGETGVTSVLATVDNTSGNPQCAVSLQGQQLTLAFTGLKGAQGDTGSSVDYPFTIVNNLTTNDATQALSAAMGVQLETEVSQLEAKVTDLALTETEEITRDSTVAGMYVYNYGNLQEWSAAKVYVYPVTPGVMIKVFSGKGRSAHVYKYAFYSTNTLSSATCVYLSGKSTNDAYADKIVVPNGAAYIGVSVVDDAATGVYLTGSIDDDNSIGIRQIRPSAFDAIPTEGSDKLLTSGTVYNSLMDFYGWKPTPISADRLISGKYISSTRGEISEYESYTLAVYNVSPGEKFRLVRTPSPQGIAIIYSIYNTADDSLWGSGTALRTSQHNIQYTGDTEIDIDIPVGGACIAVTQYAARDYFPVMNTLELKAVNYTEFSELENEVEQTEERVSALENETGENKEFYAEFDNDGESVYIAYLEGVVEYTFWFKKCMANNLYTFFRVGYRTVSRDYADTDGIKNGTGITYLNSTASDNIGPLGFVNGGLVGGNHIWNNDEEKNCKTAKTDSYRILFDDIEPTPGDKKFCKKVNVIVVNTLYNPSETPTAGQTILTIPASTETVMYEVRGKNIFVSIRQKLAADNNNVLSRYYGMQSMFNNDQYYTTPRGEFVDWTAAAADAFDKSDYPNFNRFIEKNADGYQSTFLLPNKAGAHTLMGANTTIFSYAGTKAYHSIFRDGDFTVPTPGLQFTWSGIYTFFKTAIVDDSNLFAYEGIINGKPAIFINTKQACSVNVPLPEKYLAMKMNEVERDTTITTDNEFVDVDGVSIVATGTGSFIFTLE